MGTSAPHILVVDDEPGVRRLLRTCLESDGYTVTEAATGEEVAKVIASGPVDLITLDLNLDGEDGLTIAKDVRASSGIPIVMVTGKGDTIDAVVGLELGADDYIAKPFHVREVLARIKSVLRRYQSGARASETTDAEPCAVTAVEFGPWTLHLGRRELRSSDGSVCALTTSEFDLLHVLIKHNQNVLSRDQIMDHLKGHEWSALDRSIDNQIVRLRKKIEPEPGTPRFIKTVRGVGYTFAYEVRKIHS